jgi:hypothetical protein
MHFVTFHEWREMPTWNPNWHDVSFDHVAAEDYIERCKTAIRNLEEWREARDRGAKRARKDWAGPHRETFDMKRTTINSETEEVVDRIEASARSVGNAARWAHQEQHRREQDRARWHREADDERRAEEARRAHEAEECQRAAAVGCPQVAA